MAAKVEILHERLAAVVAEIVVRQNAGGSIEELLSEREQIERELRKARVLLVEGNGTKVLTG